MGLRTDSVVVMAFLLVVVSSRTTLGSQGQQELNAISTGRHPDPVTDARVAQSGQSTSSDDTLRTIEDVGGGSDLAISATMVGELVGQLGRDDLKPAEEPGPG